MLNNLIALKRMLKCAENMDAYVVGYIVDDKCHVAVDSPSVEWTNIIIEQLNRAIAEEVTR